MKDKNFNNPLHIYIIFFLATYLLKQPNVYINLARIFSLFFLSDFWPLKLSKISSFFEYLIFDVLSNERRSTVGPSSLGTGIVYIQILYCSIHACICTYVIYIRICTYMYVYIDIYILIFVLIMYTAHQCQSKWTKYSARLRSAHHSSASAAVALVCCTARSNLSLVRCACIRSAAVVAQMNASASSGEKTGLKIYIYIYIYISYTFFGGGLELGWIGFGDMSIFLSTNQLNSWEKKLPGRG